MIIGHKKQRDILEKAILSERLPHALVFQGISSLGKKKLAIDLFKKINCKDKNSCGLCKECLSIENDNHPDLILIAPNKKEIQIGQIRDVAYKTSLHPYKSEFKWVIIDDAHLMNKDASNSLLKILEEPKGDTVFFLITEYPEIISETIKSRAQSVKFFPLKEKEITFLIKDKVRKKDDLEKTILFSFGRPGIAIDFVNNPEKLQKRVDKIKELADIISPKSPFYLRFKYAEKISKDSDLLRETLEIWLSYLRGLLLEKIKKEKINYSLEKIKKSLILIEKTIYLVTKTNTNNKIAVEVLLMEL